MVREATTQKFRGVEELKTKVNKLDQPFTCGLTLNLKVAIGYRNNQLVAIPVDSDGDPPDDVQDMEIVELDFPADHFRGVVNRQRIQQLVSNQLNMYGEVDLPEPEDVEGLPWHTATKAYTPIDPREAYSNMAEALENEGLDVYGEIRTYRRVGDIVIDVLLNEENVEVGDGDITVGFQTGTNHFGTSSLWSRTLAVTPDTEFRALTDKDTFRHTGDANGKAKKYWENTVHSIKNRTKELKHNIEAAMNHVVDFTKKDYGLPVFYYHLGLNASKYHESAAATALVHSNYSYKIDAWKLYFSAAQTLTNEAHGSKDGQQVEQYYRAINRLLERPILTEDEVNEAFVTTEEAGDESHDKIPEDVDEAAESVRDLQTSPL